MLKKICNAWAILLLLLGCQSGPTVIEYGQPDPCLQEVDAAIGQAGLSPDDVTSINMVEVLGGGRGVGPYVTGVEAWLKTTRCQSSFVIQLDNLCRYRGAYGRGDCLLPQE